MVRRYVDELENDFKIDRSSSPYFTRKTANHQKNFRKTTKNQNSFDENSQKLVYKKTQLIKKNENLIQKYTQLKLKHKKFVEQNQQYRNIGNLLIEQKNTLSRQLQKDRTKLLQFTQLFSIGQQLISLKK